MQRERDLMSLPSQPSLTFALGGETVVRRLGYGALHLTGPGFWGPPADPDNAIAVLRRAVELGVNFIDTADSYGPWANEEIIRKALHPYPDDLVICSKAGLLRTGPTDWADTPKPYVVPCGRPAYLRQQLELSLRNLGTDCIDLYELHRIDPVVPLEDQLGEFVKFREEGKIRYIGLSGQPEVTVDQIIKARAITEIAAVENQFNIADRAGEAVLRYCEENDIAFIPFFPLGHGDLLQAGTPLERPAAERGISPAQLALAWLIHHSPNILLIPGTTSVAHIEDNMKSDSIVLSAAEVEAAAEAGRQVPVLEREFPDVAPIVIEGEHPNVTTLRAVYGDVTRLAEFAREDVILHAAQRGLPGVQSPVIGRDAVTDHERALVAMTNGTLRMEVQSITANDFFGTVLGVIRGEAEQGPINMPFCGLWRFEDGVILEHWENAYDVERFFDNYALV